MNIRQYFDETNYLLFHWNVNCVAETAYAGSWRHVGLIVAKEIPRCTTFFKLLYQHCVQQKSS